MRWIRLFLLLEVCVQSLYIWISKRAVTSWFAKGAHWRINHSQKEGEKNDISERCLFAIFLIYKKILCFLKTADVDLNILTERRKRNCPCRISSRASWVAGRDGNHYTMPLPVILIICTAKCCDIILICCIIGCYDIILYAL